MKLETAITFILLWALNEARAKENETLAVYGGSATGRNHQEVALHSRRKRYIVFPKGSSLQLLLEVLVHVPTRFQVVIGPTLQVAWPLPAEVSESSRSKRSFLDAKSSVKQRTSHFNNFSRFRNISARKTPLGKRFKLFSDLTVLLDLFGITVGLAWQLPDDPMIYSEFKKKHKIYKRNIFKKMEAFMRPAGANGRECVLKALCESGQRTPSKKEFFKEILHKIFSMDDEEDEENQEDKLYRKAHQSVNQNCETLYPNCQFSIFNETE